jgi:hypothetical protein
MRSLDCCRICRINVGSWCEASTVVALQHEEAHCIMACCFELSQVLHVPLRPDGHGIWEDSYQPTPHCCCCCSCASNCLLCNCSSRPLLARRLLGAASCSLPTAAAGAAAAIS